MTTNNKGFKAFSLKTDIKAAPVLSANETSNPKPEESKPTPTTTPTPK